MKKGFFLIFTLIYFQVFSQENYDVKLAKLDEIGYAIDSTLFNGDNKYFDKIYDIKLLTDRFFIKTNDKELLKFNLGFYKGFSSSFTFGKEMLKQISTGSEYTFLRSYKEGENYFLLFRLYGDSGLNYHKHLVEFINGEPKISDTYIYLSGEYFSETIKFIYDGSVRNRNLLRRILNRSENADLKKIELFKVYKDQNDFKKVIELYESLSEKSKKRKIFMIYSLLASKNLEDSIYMKYIKSYEKEYPNDPSLYLISMDGFIIKEQYDKAIATLDKLDKSIGGDEFLDYFRGNCYYLKKDFVKAAEYFEKLMINYPNFFDGIDSLLTVYVESKENEKAIHILDVFTEKFELEKESLKELVKINFPEFTKTKEYKNWSK
ncbi:hypothetical protein [uncultured Tenacibaculum sp.]|uniref:tetratricopeptide repeat protein n=1 Tax=uncultured Tenacibaculum sp. TaxID=174713 RepID=UPI002634E1A5|nr:hypothetical protein [uncultured Tenacibaculum sp.]